MSVSLASPTVMSCDFKNSANLRTERVFFRNGEDFAGKAYDRKFDSCEIRSPATADAEVVFTYRSGGTRSLDYEAPRVPPQTEGSGLLVPPESAGIDNGAWLRHADGTVQPVTATCRARLDNRGVHETSEQLETILDMPLGSSRPCESIYGPAETTCPPRSNPVAGGSPPLTCDGDNYRAQWLTSASGGEVRLGDFSLTVPAGALRHDCYGSVLVVDPDSRLADFELHCPWFGQVTIAVPATPMLESGAAVELVHLKDDAPVSESARVTSDGRLVANVTSLSSFVSGIGRVEEAVACVENVRNTLSLRSQVLMGAGLASWAVRVCGSAAALQVFGNAAEARIGSDYDNITNVRGDGPRDVARHCAWSGAITRL